MKDYLKLLRVKHYVKNILVFLPIFFGGVIFEKNRFLNACFGFIAFSSVSSVIYILNDYKDIEKDRKHPRKKERPLASESISKKSALIMAGVCICIAVSCSIIIGDYSAFFLLLAYFSLNVFYSVSVKYTAKPPILMWLF